MKDNNREYYTCIEYPGYLSNTDPEESVKKITASFPNLQHQHQHHHATTDITLSPDISATTTTTITPAPTTNTASNLVELKLGGERDAYCHAIHGDIIARPNLLLKITYKTKKQTNNNNNSDTNSNISIIKSEIVGNIRDIIKFKGMADFQYLSKSNSPTLSSTIATGHSTVDDVYQQLVGIVFLNLC